MVPPYRSSPPHARPASGASLRRRVSGGAVAHCGHASGARFPSRRAKVRNRERFCELYLWGEARAPWWKCNFKLRTLGILNI